MKFIAGIAVVAPDPHASRRLYVDALSLALQNDDDAASIFPVLTSQEASTLACGR
jgi:hypothetical protein